MQMLKTSITFLPTPPVYDSREASIRYTLAQMMIVMAIQTMPEKNQRDIPNAAACAVRSNPVPRTPLPLSVARSFKLRSTVNVPAAVTVTVLVPATRSTGDPTTVPVPLVIVPSQEDAAARIKEITGGAGVHTLIDATGNAKVVLDSLPWIGRLGELVLLGSPRGEVQADVTDVLNYVHLWPRGCITYKGAHEWRYPVRHDPFVKHSLERNSRIVWQLLQAGKLQLEKLITHIVQPQDAAAVYEGLWSRKEDYLGVIFDWS